MGEGGKQQRSLMSEVESGKRRTIVSGEKTNRQKKDRTFFPLQPCPGCRTGCAGFKSTLTLFPGSGICDWSLFTLLFQ